MSITLSPDMHLHKADTFNELVRMINQRIEAMNATSGLAYPLLSTVAVGDRVRGSQIYQAQLALGAIANRAILKTWLVDGLPNFPAEDEVRFFTDIFGVFKQGAPYGVWRYFWPEDPNRPAGVSNNPNDLSGVNDAAYEAEGYGYGHLVSSIDLVGPWIYYDLARVLRAELLFPVTLPITSEPYTYRYQNRSVNSPTWTLADGTMEPGMPTLSAFHSAIYTDPPVYSLETRGHVEASYTFSVGLPGITKTAHLMLHEGSAPDTTYADIAGVNILRGVTKVYSATTTADSSLTYNHPLIARPGATDAALKLGVNKQQSLSAMIFMEYGFN